MTRGCPGRRRVQGHPPPKPERRKHRAQNRSHAPFLNQALDGNSGDLFRALPNFLEFVKDFTQISLLAGGWADRGDEFTAARDADALAACRAINKLGELLLCFKESHFAHKSPFIINLDYHSR